MDWRLTSPPDGSELNLRAEFGGSSCSEFSGWDVSESPTDVEIVATAEFFGDACTADMVYEPESIVLDDPLGSRRLRGCDPDSVATAGSNRPPSVDCRELADG